MLETILGMSWHRSSQSVSIRQVDHLNASLLADVGSLFFSRTVLFGSILVLSDLPEIGLALLLLDLLLVSPEFGLAWLA